MTSKNSRRNLIWGAVVLGVLLLGANFAAAQTPSPALLVLEKSDSMLAIVDPATLQIVARVPAGPDPHEIVASSDGKLAYISNYGGADSALNTIAVIDLVARKALPPINLGALRSTHGLAFAGGKLYFTAETNKVIGRYDPATQSVDWVLGTGQDRTHMVAVSESLDRIFTSNVSSGTISIIEENAVAAGSGPRKTWRVTSIAAGHGTEGFDVSPDGKEIWAASAQDATVTIIDVTSKRATQTLPISVRGTNRLKFTPDGTRVTLPISVRGANRLKFTPDGTRVLISGLGGGAGSNLVVLEAATRKEVKKFDLGGGAAGIVMVPDGSRAYVAVSGKDKVAVVDLKSMEVSGSVSTGKQPDGLAWVQGKK